VQAATAGVDETARRRKAPRITGEAYRLVGHAGEGKPEDENPGHHERIHKKSVPRLESGN
jgi:hypothetical protein